MLSLELLHNLRKKNFSGGSMFVVNLPRSSTHEIIWNCTEFAKLFHIHKGSKKCLEIKQFSLKSYDDPQTGIKFPLLRNYLNSAKVYWVLNNLSESLQIAQLLLSCLNFFYVLFSYKKCLKFDEAPWSKWQTPNFVKFL